MRTLYPSYFDEEAVKNGGGSASSSGDGGGIAAGHGHSWRGYSHEAVEIDLIDEYMTGEATEKDVTCGPCQDRTFAVAVSLTIGFGVGYGNGQASCYCTGRGRDERARSGN